jgi:hypothetical protein
MQRRPATERNVVRSRHPLAALVTTVLVIGLALAIAPISAAHNIPRSQYKTVAYAQKNGPLAVAKWARLHGRHWMIVARSDSSGLEKGKCHGVGPSVGKGKLSRYAHFDCIAPMSDLSNFLPDSGNFAILTVSFRFHVLLGRHYTVSNVTLIS